MGVKVDEVEGKKMEIVEVEIEDGGGRSGGGDGKCGFRGGDNLQLSIPACLPDLWIGWMPGWRGVAVKVVGWSRGWEWWW